MLTPCGKCLTCKTRRVVAWSFRLTEELKRSYSCHFITLTYNDTYQPITPNGYNTLLKYDLQAFFHRLRKIKRRTSQRDQRPIRYISAGEYGGKIGRPHYHILLYNATEEEITQAWTTDRFVYCSYRYKRRRSSGITHKVTCRSKQVAIGNVHYGGQIRSVAAVSAYCSKYILKPKDNDRHPSDDSQQEFLHFSKGLGSNYLSPTMVKYHRTDLNNRMFITIPSTKGAYKAAMPRYYKTKIYTDKEREAIQESLRAKVAEDILKQLMQYMKDETDFEGYADYKQQTEERIKASERKQHSVKNQQFSYVKEKQRNANKRVTTHQNIRQCKAIPYYGRNKQPA